MSSSSKYCLFSLVSYKLKINLLVKFFYYSLLKSKTYIIFIIIPEQSESCENDKVSKTNEFPLGK